VTIAFLGTGLLGTGFVEHLLATTGQVAVWNRTAARATPLAAAGATVAATPAEAVRGAGRVHLCLSDDAAVDAVLELAGPGLSAEAVIVDHSTTSPDGAAARAARFAAAGRGFLHAPVFMGPQAARDGKGMMMCVGPEAVYHRVDAALAAMTGEVWYLGEDPRRAAAMKLLGNSMLIAIAAALADTLTLATALGVPAADTQGLLARLRPGGTIDVRGKRMAEGDFSATFELSMARKDLRLMLDALDQAPLAALRAIAARADELIARGHGADDLGVLAVDALPR